MTCVSAFAETYDPEKYNVITSERYGYIGNYIGVTNPTYDYVDGAYHVICNSNALSIISGNSNITTYTSGSITRYEITGPCVIRKIESDGEIDGYSIIYFPSSAFDTTPPTLKITGIPTGWVSAEQGIKLAVVASDDGEIVSIKYKIN